MRSAACACLPQGGFLEALRTLGAGVGDVLQLSPAVRLSRRADEPAVVRFSVEAASGGGGDSLSAAAAATPSAPRGATLMAPAQGHGGGPTVRDWWEHRDGSVSTRVTVPDWSHGSIPLWRK